jgi:hypothetical protein
MSLPADQEVVARTMKGFCEAYGVGITKAYELIADGTLEARKMGRRVFIIEKSAQRWIAGLPAHSLSHTSGAAAGESQRKSAKERGKRQYHKSRRKVANNPTITSGFGA